MTFVLVHGATFAASCWDRLVPHLEGDVVAVDLPGRGNRPAELGTLTVADFVAAVVAEIEARDLRDVVLVGHSLAGVTLPGVAARVPDRLARLVFVAATVPEHGCSVLSTLDRATRGVAAENTLRADLSPGEAWARAAFCNDMDEEQAQWTLAHMGAEAPGVLSEPVDLRGLRAGVPLTWVKLLRDAIVPPDRQERFAHRIGAELVELDAGHMAMISRPAQLAQRLHSIRAT